MRILKPTQTRQPAGTTAIDRGNPITKGLAYARKGADLDTARRTGTKRIPRLDAAMDGFGATFGVGTTDGILLPFGAAATQRTYLAVVVWNAAGGGSQGRIFDKHSNGSAGFPEAFYTSNTTVTYTRGHSTTAGAWTGAIPVNLTNSETVPIVLSYDSSSTANSPKIYVRGLPVTVSTVSTPVGTPVVNTAEYGLGNRLADSIRNFDGAIGCFFIWDRILSDDEIAQVSRNPWQVFRAPSRMGWMFDVAIGGSFSLTSTAGSYTTTGSTANLVATRYLDTTPSAYIITGSGAAVNASRSLESVAGSYSVAGNTVNVVATRYLDTTAGFFSIAGSVANLSYTFSGIYRPGSDIAVAGWVPIGASTVFETLDESTPNDSDYSTSPDLSTPATLGLIVPLPAGTWNVKVRGSRDTSQGQVRVRFLDSSNVDVGGTAWQTLTNSVVEYTLSATTTNTADRFKIEVQP